MLWGLPFFTFLRFVNHLVVVKALETANDTALSTQPDKTWLWSWAWGSESTVSIVDRTPVISYLSRPAAFGAEIDNPILGYIIPLSSFTVPCLQNETTLTALPPNPGCPDLCQAGPNSPSEPFIALVQRGQCEFVRKVREAQRLGAKAVVVGGDDPAESGYPDTLVNMYSPEDSSDIRIAATFIKFSDYMQLYSLIANSNTTHSGLQTLSVLITADYSAWEWYSPIITFIIILLLPSILTFLTLLIHRIRATRAARRERAPEDIVKRLPWRIYTGHGWEKPEGGDPVDDPPALRSSEVDLEEGVPSEETSAQKSHTPTNQPAEHPWFKSQLECAICLSGFVKGDKVRVLPCHHIFHVNEIDEWLIHRKKLCPICKADVTQPCRPPHISSSSSTQIPNQDASVHSSPPTPDANERTPLLPHDQ